MLGSIATILKSAFEAGLIITLFMVTLKKAGLRNLTRLVWLGVAGAVVSALVIVFGFDFFGDREVFEGYFSFVTSIVAIAFWGWMYFLLKRSDGENQLKKKSFFTGIWLATTAGVLILGKTIEIALFPNTVFVMSTNLINTEMILKLSGSLVGLLIAFLFTLFFWHTEHKISRRRFLLFSGVIFLIIIFRQLIAGLQVLFATGVLPLTSFAISIIAPLINSYFPFFFYALIGLVAILWLLSRFLRNPGFNNTGSTGNPAEKRKILAGIRRERRWLNALGISILTMILIFIGNAAIAREKSKVDPPQPVVAQNGKISLPLKEINDGKLHRYSYKTKDNLEIRFLVIKKGENLYGTGFDACDICGQAGYYQRGKEVVCKNCDVVINIPTIGFPGGCNPIPLKNVVDGSQLVIETINLEAKQDVFKD